VSESALTNLKGNILYYNIKIYLGELTANVTGLPTLYSYSLNTLSYNGANNIDSTVTYRVDTGPSYVFVEGLTLLNDGIIYVIIGNKDLWTRDPTVSEIKKGSGPNGLPPVYFRVLAYKKTVPKTSYLAWK
jgi:hypothetical protein